MIGASDINLSDCNIFQLLDKLMVKRWLLGGLQLFVEIATTSIYHL